MNCRKHATTFSLEGLATVMGVKSPDDINAAREVLAYLANCAPIDTGPGYVLSDRDGTIDLSPSTFLAVVHRVCNWDALCAQLVAARAEVDRLRFAEADALALVLSHEGRIAQLEGRIARAFEWASGRWSEWGERALSVAAILDGEDPDARP